MNTEQQPLPESQPTIRLTGGDTATMLPDGFIRIIRGGKEWWMNTEDVRMLLAILPPLPESQPAGRAEGKPTIVTLCGSSRWPGLHFRLMMHETLAGRIVIPMGLYGHANFPEGARAVCNDGDESNAVKQLLDTLHYRKIDVADEILVVRVDGYVGSSTAREIEYARTRGKAVRFHDATELHASAANQLLNQPEPKEAEPTRKSAGFEKPLRDSLTGRVLLPPVEQGRTKAECNHMLVKFSPECPQGICEQCGLVDPFADKATDTLTDKALSETPCEVCGGTPTATDGKQALCLSCVVELPGREAKQKQGRSEADAVTMLNMGIDSLRAELALSKEEAAQLQTDLENARREVDDLKKHENDRTLFMLIEKAELAKLRDERDDLRRENERLAKLLESAHKDNEHQHREAKQRNNAIKTKLEKMRELLERSVKGIYLIHYRGCSSRYTEFCNCGLEELEKEITAALEENGDGDKTIEQFRAALEAVLNSATPNERDNPAMFKAWQSARLALDEKGGGE